MARQTQPTQEQFAAYEFMFRHFNRTLFNDNLPPVILNFSRRAKSYGFFAPERWQRAQSEETTHEISINPAHLATRPPQETASTLVHEMCHLWQHVHGDPPRSGYHDREWAGKMTAVGLQPIDPKTGKERMSAHLLTHKIIPGGAFDLAFQAMPSDHLLPWQCSEATTCRKGGGGGKGGEEEGETKTRNKTKYTCPCGINVWGKPGLNMICGDCREPFIDLAGVGAGADAGAEAASGPSAGRVDPRPGCHPADRAPPHAAARRASRLTSTIQNCES